MNHNVMRNYTAALVAILFLFVSAPLMAQIQIGGGSEKLDLSIPAEYEIGGITVSGAKNFDSEAVILFTGLSIGDRITIPGTRIQKAIKNLWEQDLFSDVKIRVADVRNNNVVYLNILLGERARLSRYKFEGIKKSEAESLREDLGLRLGTVVNENLLQNTKNKVLRYFWGKGYYKVEVDIEQTADSILNKSSIALNVKVKKGGKVKVDNIFITRDSEPLKNKSKSRAPKTMQETKGEREKKGFRSKEDKPIKEGMVRRAMKKTKENIWWKIFQSANYLEASYKRDKVKVIEKFNEKGYRNAKIISDSVHYNAKKNMVDIYLNLEEGNKFYFNNFRWVGNSKYTSEYLDKVLNIKPGEVYNEKLLNERLVASATNSDVSSLYLDDGYLSFSAQPVEVAVNNDSIDFEIRIYEGKQFIIDKVTIMGNTKTNDKVIRRELRTKPGDLFSRSDLQRSMRELIALGYFNQEEMDVRPTPNPQDGTVNLEYIVGEKPSDQIELSGGWGAGRIVGTLGLRFTNFSTRNLFRKGFWDPLPSGDGQTLSIRAQTNGAFYQGYSFSFIEPWLGGKKPNSFSVSLTHSVQSNGELKEIVDDETGLDITNPNRRALKISGITVGLGKRLRVPDDYFSLMQSISYQYYDINNYGSIFSFANGYSNVVAYNVVLRRNSVHQPIFPTSGSNIAVSLKATPPYSMFSGKDYSDASDQEKYKFVEYHKWKFTADWYTGITKKIVIKTKVGFGAMGSYNSDIGSTPFERFYLGGSALTGYNLDGREIIGLRGYDDLSLSPRNGGLIISKYTTELRFLLSPNPSATVYLLGFMEAGNSWDEYKEFDPFSVKRSAGVGLRIFLPMFGLMGLDYGWRFDDVPGYSNMAKSQFHFTIGMNLGEL